MTSPLPPSLDETRLLAIVRGLATELRHGAADAQRLGLDNGLERDFGLDSLARVELLARLQREFGRPGELFDDEALVTADTPRDLLHLLAAGASVAGVPEFAEADTNGMRSHAAPDDAPTITALLDWHVAHHPEWTHIRLYDEGASTAQDISYRALHEEARTLAAGLLARGLQPGERVAMMLPTCRGFFAAFYGILYAGGVPVPLYPPARPSQLEDHMRRIAAIVANAGAVLLIADSRVRLLGHLLRAECEALRAVDTVDELMHAPAPAQWPQLQPGDVAFLQYTSGSTSQPKGVVLTHANLLANLRAMAVATGVTADDVFVSWLPLYHDMGLIGACLGSLAVGFRLVLMSPLAFLARPERWLWTLHQQRGTVSAAPNFAYELCAARIDAAVLEGLDLSRWRLAFNGAEPVAAGTLERFCQRYAAYGFAPQAMTPVYGLAENSVGLTFPPLGRGPRIDHIDRHLFATEGRAQPAGADHTGVQQVVCSGAVLPGHQLRVVDDAGQPLPERHSGRVQFRGPSATSGYFHHTDVTLFDGDWLNTGDLGYLADGELFLTGRAKDIIIRGGHNLYPQELEEAVGCVPGIRRGGVAVFAASDPRTGSERLVVLAETRVTDATERARLSERISHLAVDLLGQPADDIVLAPPQTVLKTSSGKIRRSACREHYEAGTLMQRMRPPWQQVLRLAAASLRTGLTRRLRASGSWLWSAWAWTVFATLVPPAWLLITLTPTLTLRRRCARASARLALALSGLPVRVDGLHHVDATGPCVIVANHASYLDALLLTAVLPPHFAYVAKRELQQSPLAAIPLRRLGSMFVERHDQVRSIEHTRELEARARAGEALLFFAEGTFRAAPGLLPFRLGAFSAATAAGLPVIPLCLRGTRQTLRDGQWRPQRQTVDILIGAPLRAQGQDWNDTVTLRDAARAWIAAKTGEDDSRTER
jgi:1-acyl-sn-glycerol-3-phosphate acyltransferase